MNDQKSLTSVEETYSYLNKVTGEVETINIISGEIIGKKKFESSTYKYSSDFCDLVCQLIREGKTFTDISKIPGFPSYNTICRWKRENSLFNEAIKEANKDRASLFMDEVIDISRSAKDGNVDKDSVAAMRLAVDGFEKAAAAGNPSEFGKAKDQQVRVENLIIIQTGIDSPVIQSPIEVKKIED